MQGDIGLNVAKMIAELIRDNRKIVDRISQEQIELFVGLLKLNKVSLSCICLVYVFSPSLYLENYKQNSGCMINSPGNCDVAFSLNERYLNCLLTM